MPAALAAGPLPRPAFLHLDDVCGWRIKTYGVGVGHRPRPALVAAARRAIAGTLPDRPDLDGSCGLGFLIVHDDPDLSRALLHWWVRPDLLHQRVFVTDPGMLGSFAPVSAAPIGTLCDLAIIEYEGQAWHRHVSGSRSGPDLDAYLVDVWGTSGGCRTPSPAGRLSA